MESVTTYPQLIHSLFTWLPLVFSIAALAFALHLKRRFFRDEASRTAINAIRLEVSDLSGQVADLADRFTRFQKREGMRAAREEKENVKSLKEQAMEIMAAQAGGSAPGSDPSDIKATLRRQLYGRH